MEAAPAAPTLVIRTDALEKKPETKTKKRKESVVIEGAAMSTGHFGVSLFYKRCKWIGY